MQTKDKDISYVSRQIPASIICKWEVNTWLFEASPDLTTAISFSELGQRDWGVKKLINVRLKQHDFGTVEHAVILFHSCSEVIYSEKLQEMCLSTDPE